MSDTIQTILIMWLGLLVPFNYFVLKNRIDQLEKKLEAAQRDQIL